MDDAGKAPEKKLSWDDDGFYEMSFGICRSKRYHDYMRDCYRRLNEYIIATAALTGSAAFLVLVPSTPNLDLARPLTAAAGVASLLNLLLKFGKKADLHDDLARRFNELAAEVSEWEATPECLARARTKRLKIESDEPPVRRLIDLRAQNDELSARGMPATRLIPLGFWQRSWLAYHFTFGEKAAREAYEKVRRAD